MAPLPALPPIVAVDPAALLPPAVGAAATVVATVTTPDELATALASGVRHIEIKDHLDLRGFQLSQATAATARRLLARRRLLDLPGAYVDPRRAAVLPSIASTTTTINVRPPPPPPPLPPACFVLHA